MRDARWWMVPMVVLLGACASAPVPVAQPAVQPPEPPALRTDVFGPATGIPTPGDIFTLTPQQQAHFLGFFHDPVNAVHAPHERIYQYMVGRLSEFSYYGSTQTASQALAETNGNCLSLAVLTTALARLAGVEVGYQRVRNTMVYERHDTLVTVADHVRSRLYDPNFEPDPDLIQVRRPHIVIDYFPEQGQRRGGRVDEDELLAMVYVNLAGEALLEQDLPRAFWLLQAALEHAPGDAGAWNSMAVLHRMAGHPDTAEAVFRHGLALNTDDLNLLGNLRLLVRNQGRLEEAEVLERRMLQLPNRDPYRLIEFGLEAQAEGRMQRALAFYARAVELAPYLHEGYWRMAVVHDARGESARAAALLEEARRTAPRVRDRHLYDAKLLALVGK